MQKMFKMQKMLAVLCLVSVFAFAGCKAQLNDSVENVEITTMHETVSNATVVPTDVTTDTPTDVASDTTTDTTAESIATETTNVVVTVAETSFEDMTDKEQVACFEQNGAKLAAYVDEAYTSYVVYYDAAGDATVLYNQQGPMGAVVESYNSETFAPYQNFENTAYMLNDASMGVGQLIKTWHLTPDGTVIDLADTIDFAVENTGLYISSTNIDGVEKNVIGLREQIPGTDAIGASQVLPVTLDNGKIVKLDVEPITE